MIDKKLGRISRPIPPGVPSLTGHKLAAMQAPPRLIRDHIAYQPQMLANDFASDCACAALGNAILAQAALGGFGVAMPTDRVLALYSAVTGYPAVDDGAVEVDVLRYQLQHGFDTGGQTPYVGAWANIDAGDWNLLRLAMAHLGVGYLGVSLALADQHDGLWDTETPASYGDPTPGSWGGHALLAWSYAGTADTDVVQLVTWGGLQPCTWRWLKSRMEEAHAVVHRQLASAAGLNYASLDWDRIMADGEAFAA